MVYNFIGLNDTIVFKPFPCHGLEVQGASAGVSVVFAYFNPGLMGSLPGRGDIYCIADGGAVGPCDGGAVTVSEIDIVTACFVVVQETVDFAAFVLEKIFHVIIFVIFGRYIGDGMLSRGAG